MVHETKESSLHRSPTYSLLAQLAEHKTDDLKVVSSNSTGAIFDEIYFVLCNFRSDRNASDFFIVKNPNEHYWLLNSIVTKSVFILFTPGTQTALLFVFP